jgi:hypothetical protein
MILKVGTGIKNKTELLLALFYAGEDINSNDQKSEKIEGITRLEKLLFLLKMEKGFLKNVEKTNDFNFFPFRMGPWTNEVYDEIDFLESLNLISKSGSNKINPVDNAYVDELFNNVILDKYQKNSFHNEECTETFSITPLGKEKALKVWNSLTIEEQYSIIELKKKYNRMDLKNILRHVYINFPEYTTESEIKENLGLNN